MKNNILKMKDLIFSLDIGTRSIIGSVGIIKNNKFCVISEKYKEHEERAMIDGQIHDIDLVAKTIRTVKEQLEEELEVELKDVAIAAAGRFLKTATARVEVELSGNEEIDKDIIRGLELSAVKKAEETVKESSMGKLYCVGYSVKNYYLNSFVISNLLGHKGEKIEAEVIATFLPRTVVDSLYSVTDKVNLNVINLTLEPIAAIEAVVPQKLRLLNIALVDIGAGTSDIAISSNETVSAYGMVPMAGDEVTEAIAKQYLVDFNDGERIKKESDKLEEIKYTDILGIDNVIKSEDVKKVEMPVVKKLGQTIGEKIMELNGGKAPQAVFLVGGGAHTPSIIDEISENLGLPTQRIAIKDRSAVEECICDNELGSAGVTVLGIALTAIKNLGDNFIDVELNGDVISLFNSHKNTVLDVLIHAGINPALLIAKNGKSKRFTINGKKRLVFGEMGKNAVIDINGKISDTDTEIHAKDKIKIEYAKNGKAAEAKVSDYLGEVNSITIMINNEITNIEPICLINGERKEFSENINEGDNIEVFLPDTIGNIKKYVLKENKEFFKDGLHLNDEYKVTDGEEIYLKVEDNIESDDSNNLEKTKVSEVSEEVKGEAAFDLDNNKEEVKPLDDNIELNVIVNDEKVVLKNKKQYIFVDIFDFYEFDTHTIRGRKLLLTVNGEEAKYTNVLKENDVIVVKWIN